MRGLTVWMAAAVMAAPAWAQEGSVDCQAVLDAVLADRPTEYRSCAAEIVPAELRQCETPETAGGRPSSHILLAIDASGSMAGRVGGETKMAAAKREALGFLRDMPQEVSVGLVIYGHEGNNEDSGKAESCAATEMVHGFDAPRSALEASIGALEPVGWTPLGGVLAYSAEVVAELEPPKEGDLAPVIYLISDGEETCDGDPAAQAAALYEAGVRTTVNTIGFDVDAETAAQLEAIAEAAGGTYYPADDVAALRRQLDAITAAEASLARYRNCVNANLGRIAAPYHDARIALAGCYARNDPMKAKSALMNRARKAERDATPEAACAEMLTAHALAMELDGGFLNRQFKAWGEEAEARMEAYREEMRLDAE
ncbi:von Willebrand factor type A domain protein [Roseovarius sp. THAF27]|uniref:VWA domain-containing protein n=1 Tax=Roseovarius sp. THAF27 TaxID=2587850 RepID=UPI001268F1E9|nr:VWA domain-containing protein [Roseovarius sp. THAF27]QFT79610.1 von Willebrand factor type A domain protein [Roseovarius sp. THAF27]